MQKVRTQVFCETLWINLKRGIFASLPLVCQLTWYEREKEGDVIPFIANMNECEDNEDSERDW